MNLPCCTFQMFTFPCISLEAIREPSGLHSTAVTSENKKNWIQRRERFGFSRLREKCGVRSFKPGRTVWVGEPKGNTPMFFAFNAPFQIATWPCSRILVLPHKHHLSKTQNQNGSKGKENKKLMTLSSDPEHSRVESGDHRTQFTTPVWWFNNAKRPWDWSVTAAIKSNFQILIVLSVTLIDK